MDRLKAFVFEDWSDCWKKQKPLGLLQEHIRSKKKFHHIHIDVGEPLEKPKSDNSFLVKIDASSKYVIAEPIKAQNAATRVRFLVEEVICKISAFTIVSTDRSTILVSDSAKKIEKLEKDVSNDSIEPDFF